MLARHFQHTWYSRLDIPAIDLGRGKRQLVKSGVLDKEYQITVPGRFANADDNRYREQVQLLVQVLPLVAEEKMFALKGGTAINLFIHDMPRLSVDIDLAFLPAGERKEDLAQC